MSSVFKKIRKQDLSEDVSTLNLMQGEDNHNCKTMRPTLGEGCRGPTSSVTARGTSFL